MRGQLQRGQRHGWTAAGVGERGVGGERSRPREAARPAVRRALANLGHVVGGGAATGPVALVDRRPQRSGRRVKRKPDRVAQPGGEDLLARAIGVVANDRRAARIGLLADVAGRADRDVELVVGAEGDRARPVMRAVRQRADHDGPVDGRQRRGAVAIAHDAAGLGGHRTASRGSSRYEQNVYGEHEAFGARQHATERKEAGLHDRIHATTHAGVARYGVAVDDKETQVFFGDGALHLARQPVPDVS